MAYKFEFEGFLRQLLWQNCGVAGWIVASQPGRAVSRSSSMAEFIMVICACFNIPAGVIDGRPGFMIPVFSK
jgi:hypothetical protein